MVSFHRKLLNVDAVPSVHLEAPALPPVPDAADARGREHRATIRQVMRQTCHGNYHNTKVEKKL